MKKWLKKQSTKQKINNDNDNGTSNKNIDSISVDDHLSYEEDKEKLKNKNLENLYCNYEIELNKITSELREQEK